MNRVSRSQRFDARVTIANAALDVMPTPLANGHERRCHIGLVRFLNSREVCSDLDRGTVGRHYGVTQE